MTSLSLTLLLFKVGVLISTLAGCSEIVIIQERICAESFSRGPDTEKALKIEVDFCITVVILLLHKTGDLVCVSHCSMASVWHIVDTQ